MTTTTPGLAPVRTLGDLFLRSERVHDRPYAVQGWHDGKAEPLPDWRLHRQILRAAVYLRERAKVGPGDRVALVGELGPRALVFEWGALILGAAAALLDPLDPPPTKVVEALGARTVFDVSASWSRALDLGGTLDTAERAQALRGSARAIDPAAPALAYLAGSNGTRAWSMLSHAETMVRVHRFWSSGSRSSDVTVTMPALRHASLEARVSLYAYVGDGRTRVAFRKRDDSNGGEANGQHDRRPGA